MSDFRLALGADWLQEAITAAMATAAMIVIFFIFAF
jgi:hypothetical protein